MLVILLVPCVSAIQSDSFIKDQNKIDELNTKTNYGTYIIEERSWWDLFGWITDKEIKKVILKDNTDTCGDDGEVILNSPADGATAYTNLQTFNATATVTGGSTLENISLWTNETGDWIQYNATDVFGGRKSSRSKWLK